MIKSTYLRKFINTQQSLTYNYYVLWQDSITKTPYCRQALYPILPQTVNFPRTKRTLLHI